MAFTVIFTLPSPPVPETIECSWCNNFEIRVTRTHRGEWFMKTVPKALLTLQCGECREGITDPEELHRPRRT
jgi:hypothetical protein